VSAAQILKTVETMSYGERIKHMVTLGRDMQSHSADIAELRAGSVYERLLALYTCYTSHDADHVMEAISDESRLIRSQALKLLTMVGSDAQVMGVLEAHPLRGKRALMISLVKDPSRQVTIDLYLEQCVERQQNDNARSLLSFASAPIVRQYIEQLVQPGHLNTWTEIARRHPALALSELHRHAQTARPTDYWIVAAARSALPFLLKSRVKNVIPFVQTLLHHFDPNVLSDLLQQITMIYPQEMGKFALAASGSLPIHFEEAASRITDVNVIAALVEKQYLSAPHIWFHKLPIAHRMALYERFALGWHHEQGSLGHRIVGALNPTQRMAEARRHMSLPALQTRSESRLSYASFLPWAEAQTILEPYLGNPDPQLRIAAISSLIQTIRYDRSHAADMLTFLRTRKNEQDPIRMVIFNALRHLAPGLWRTEHLEDLGQLIRSALNAADLSAGTSADIDAFILSLLRFHPLWAIQWLVTMMQERGGINVYSEIFEKAVPKAAMSQIGAAMMPVLHSWQLRENEKSLMNLANSLGQRLRLIPAFADILDRLVIQSTTGVYKIWALRMLREHFKERAALLIPRLIVEDPSWATQEGVYNFLHRYRQDLITPFLGQTAYTGRFSTGKTRFVMPLDQGFERWTPAQQAIFERTLADLSSDSERDTPAVIGSIHQLTKLMYILPIRLLALIEDKRPAVRDTALRALGRLDGREGVEALLGVMDDDRGRIAIYALRRALLQMPSDQALAVLTKISLRKITIAKEVIRLIGEMNTEAAFKTLLAFAQQDLHRDVRIALLRAFWTHLERDETWTILMAAANSADSAVAAMAGRTMAPSRSSEIERRLIQLMIRVMQHTDPQVRVDVLNRLGSQAVHDADQILAEPLIERLSSPLQDEVNAAAAAFSAYTRENAGLARQVVTQLLSNRRTLQTLISTFARTLWAGSNEVLTTGRSIIEALSTDPMTVKLRLDIGWTIFSIAEFADLIQTMADARELHAEALMYAAARLSNHRNLGTSEAAAVEQAWRNDLNPALRRMGLAILIGNAKPPFGWNAERRAILEQYRQDPYPLIASVAQFTFPPDEPDTEVSV
jgi:HEAT repeat protein